MKSRCIVHLVSHVMLMSWPPPQELNERNTSQTPKSKSSNGWQAYQGVSLVLGMWKCPDVLA